MEVTGTSLVDDENEAPDIYSGEEDEDEDLTDGSEIVEEDSEVIQSSDKSDLAKQSSTSSTKYC